MGEFSRFSRLVLQIQEAALGPGRWNAVVDSIVRETGGTEGLLFSPALPPSLGGFWASRSITANQMADYAAYYHQRDIWLLAGEALISKSGAVFPDTAIVHPDAVKESEFYNDFLRHINIGRLLCGIVAPKEDSTIRGGLRLSIFRPMNHQGFESCEKQLIERLMPHLQTSIATYYAIGARDYAEAISHAALNALSTAVFIVERDATIVFANDAAHKLLAQADGVLAVRKHLAGAGAGSTEVLRHFIATLFPPDNSHPLRNSVRIDRPSRKKSYACFGQYLPIDAALALAARPAALLFVCDPEFIVAVEPEVLMRLYGLTTAEAFLANSLARGNSLENAAKARGISYETARTQLRSLFSKTGCRRQAQLVSLLAGSRPA